MKTSIRYIVILAVLFLSACSTGGINYDPLATLPVTGELTKGVLPNGLTYLVRPNNEPENRATLMLVVNAGTVLEDEGQRGAAHFVEHMAFNGTQNFPGKAIERFMESIGMGTCECYNAYTGADNTVYKFAIPTEESETINTMLSVLADIANNISFEPGEVEKERGVLVEEWRQGKGMDRRLANKAYRMLYKGTPYERIAKPDDASHAESVDIEEMKAFYQSWYRPDLMAVIAVGDFDPGEMESMIKEKFSHLRVPADAQARPVFKIPDRPEDDYVLISNPKTNTFNITTLHLRDFRQHALMGDYRKSYVRSIFISMMNERLDIRQLEKSPPFLSAGCSLGRQIHSKSAFSITVSSEAGRLDEALAAVSEEVGRVVRDGFLQSEFDRRKKEIKMLLEDADEDEDKPYSSTLASELMRHYLDAEPVPGYDAELAINMAALESITLEDINSLADNLLRPDNRLIIAGSPEGKEDEAPDKISVQAWLDGLRESSLDPYVDVTPEGGLLTEEPSPGKVVGKRRIESIDAEEWVLSNGATVVLKPAESDDHSVSMTVYSPGGHSLASDSDYPTAVSSAAIVLAGGVGRFDIQSLQNKLSGLKASAYPYIEELEEGMYASANAGHEETMFRLAYLYFTSPRKDEAMFSNIRDRARLSLQQAEMDPNMEFKKEISRLLYNDHPRKRQWSNAMVDSLDLDKALDFYGDRFGDASDFTFFIVGEFKPRALRPLIKRYIASLPSKHRKESWQDVGVRLPRGIVKKEISSGQADKSSVYLMFNGDAQWSEQASYDLGLMVNVLRNRLRESLREEKSGTYGVKVSGGLTDRPRPQYGVTVTFNSSPGQTEELSKEVFAQIAWLKDKKNLESYVDAIVKKQQKAQENIEKDDDYWMGRLVYFYKNGISPEEHMEFEDLVKNATPEAVAATARKYLDLENFIQIIYHHGT